MTKATFLAARGDELERRARLLTASDNGEGEGDRRRLSAAIEELHAAIASLRTGDELLRQQNEELDAAIARAEREHAAYYTLFEFAPVGLLITDDRGIIREANRAAALLFTCERHHLMGKEIASYLDADSQRKVLDRIARAFTAVGSTSCWATTAPGRGAPRRLIITLERHAATKPTERRIRWAIQPRNGSDGASSPAAAQPG